jgi:hypothetical protein
VLEPSNRVAESFRVTTALLADGAAIRSFGTYFGFRLVISLALRLLD